MFFSILKFWFFRLSLGWKGKKGPKMTKNFCLLYLIFQEPYVIHLWYTCMYKKILSPGIFFFFFKNFDFRYHYGGARLKVKNDPKWQKISACLVLYFRNHVSFIYCTHVCIKGSYLHEFFFILFFFFFQNFDFRYH